MVIVEYCRFGNLQNFLVKHRNYFVDQIVREKDVIDPSIVSREQRWSGESGYPYYNRYVLCDLLHMRFFREWFLGLFVVVVLLWS